MILKRFSLQNFRNISYSAFNLSPGLNVFYGKNASGKTSILESIYYLNTGRSFRSKQTNEVIKNGNTSFALNAIIADNFNHQIGIQKNLSGETRLKLDGDIVSSFAQLNKSIPIQLMTPHGFHFLETGPEEKRRYIDWGVFHVEPTFLNAWRHYKKALKHRNVLLKNPRCELFEVESWEEELNKVAGPITQMRQQYCNNLFPVISIIAKELLQIKNIEMKFIPGWDTDSSYLENLQSNRKKDRIIGFTQAGPHKSNMLIYIDSKPAHETLSRGQQKLFICALTTAQGSLLKSKQSISSLFLIDDIISELDQLNRDKALNLLGSLDMQVIASCVDRRSLANISLPYQLFHVEQGQIDLEQIE